MKIYVFGNTDVKEDRTAIDIAKKLQREFKNIEFVFIKPNQDLPFEKNENVIILDVIMGITSIKILNFEDIDLLKLPPLNSAHEFDLGFQLKYLKKLGKISNAKIIGIPYGKKNKLFYNPINFKKVSSARHTRIISSNNFFCLYF